MNLLKEFNDNYVSFVQAIDNINDGNGLEFVFGDGNTEPFIMLIGEAPGKDEVIIKKPFVGQAGKILSQFLELADLTRDDLYITNAIKYRLSKPGARPGTFVNRPAKLTEIETARSFLHEEVKIVKPKIIVPMGNVPLKALLGRDLSIGDCHGRILDVKIHGINVYPIYHPASLIYNRNLNEVYIDDIKRLSSFIPR